MRDIKVIEAEIAKLQAEATDVRMDISKKNAAVSILGNIGWTWSAKEGWKKPTPKPDVKLKDFKATVKAGDFATHDHFMIGCSVYVHSVNYSTGQAVVSWLRNVTASCKALVEQAKFEVKISELTVRPKDWSIGRS